MIVILNDCSKTSRSNAKNELIKFKQTGKGIQKSVAGRLVAFYNNLVAKIRLPPFLRSVSIHHMHPPEE